MHCSGKFQDKMHDICVEIFKERLLLLPDDENSMSKLPSPWELRNKVKCVVKCVVNAVGH